jgi:predicted flap endonuclease-1-like 5' DNA nuclease
MEEGHDMENSTKNSRCATWCWVIAAAVGILVALLLWTTRDLGIIQGAFLGLLIFIIGGALLSWLLCKPQAQATSADVKPSSELVGSNELAERKGNLKYEKPEAEGAKLAAKKATDKTAKPKAATATKAKKATTATKAKATSDAKAPVKKAAAKTTKTAAKAKASGADAKASIAPTAKVAGKTTAKKADAAVKGTTAKTASAKTAVTTAAPANAVAPKATTAKKSAPARAPVAADGKPSTMSKARAGGADDLKLLKGVGPGLEKTLNELGFYHFDQVAAWRKKEIDWVDGNLRFKGRIERDEWTKQAKILAKGGTTAFATKAKKG